MINCAGYTGKPNVDACEAAKADTIVGNVSLPKVIADACAAAGVPWGQASSGCICAGAKMAFNLGRIMRLLIGAGKPRYAQVLAEKAPLALFTILMAWLLRLIASDAVGAPSNRTTADFSPAPG